MWILRPLTTQYWHVGDILCSRISLYIICKGFSTTNPITKCSGEHKKSRYAHTLTLEISHSNLSPPVDFQSCLSELVCSSWSELSVFPNGTSSAPPDASCLMQNDPVLLKCHWTSVTLGFFSWPRCGAKCENCWQHTDRWHESEYEKFILKKMCCTYCDHNKGMWLSCCSVVAEKWREIQKYMTKL